MPTPKDDLRCTHYYLDGRRCRMPRIENHPSLCFYHWQQEERLAESVKVSREIISPREKLVTAQSINRVLGRLLRALAQNRITTRQATTLAYIAQLMLTTLPHLEKERPPEENPYLRQCREFMAEVDQVMGFKPVEPGPSDDPAAASAGEETLQGAGPTQAHAPEQAASDSEEQQPDIGAWLRQKVSGAGS